MKSSTIATKYRYRGLIISSSRSSGFALNSLKARRQTRTSEQDSRVLTLTQRKQR
jgi:hypothetical protein